MVVRNEGKDSLRLERKARRQEKRRQKILRITLEILQKRGVNRLTIALVAEEADLTPSAIYYYFKSKEEMIEALSVDLLTQEVDYILRAIEKAETAVAALIATLHAKVSFYQKQMPIFQLTVETLTQGKFNPKTLQEQIYPLSNQVNSALEERLLAAQAAGEIHQEIHPRKLANLAYLMAQGILMGQLSMQQVGGALKFTVEDLCDEACATLRRACRP